MAKEVNGVELEKEIKEGLVLVDFFSRTCGPCKMLSFILDAVDKEIEQVKIVKVCFEENKETVEKYGVEGYPTIILFKDGKEVERKQALQQKPVIEKMIKEYI